MSTQTSVTGSVLSSQGVPSSFGQPVYTQSGQMTSMHQGPNTATVPAQPQMMSPKSMNYVSLCKLGQETNQELVNKLLDVFKQFKTLQLPNGTNSAQYHDRRIKIEDSLRQLNGIFRKLRAIYDKVSETVIDPNENPEEVLVPLKGDPLEERNTNTEAYRYASEEHKQIVEQLTQRNQQMKEVIDKIRTIMWEINTMIVMRKT